MIEIYTGDGKGKTTASFGLAIRAAGHGLNVKILQFLKRSETGEIKFLKRYNEIKVYQFGTGEFVRNGKIPQHLKEKTKEGWKMFKKFIQDENTDLIILDEFTHVINLSILKREEVIDFFKNIKNIEKEIVITGRNADPSLIEIADLVTEMKKIKHPYDKGIKGRRGIEY